MTNNSSRYSSPTGTDHLQCLNLGFRSGYTLGFIVRRRWRQDEDFTIAGLAANIFGTKEWMRELAKIGGSKSSPAKAEAARLNGKKSGRPARSPKPTLSTGVS